LLIEMAWAESTAIIEQMPEDNDMLDARTISTDELRQRLDHGHIAHLWNVLTSQYFTGEIIPGSRRMPLDTIGHAMTSVPKDAEIITYCGGPKCPQSAQAAQRLRELGYTNVRAYEEASRAGRPLETPSKRFKSRRPRLDRRRAVGGSATCAVHRPATSRFA
jgi:rhodanese-related sulfurtransferase